MKKSVIFFGTPDFAVPCLKALLEHPDFAVRLVVTQPDRAAGRGKELTESPVKRLALEHNIPLFQPEKLRKEHERFVELATGIGPFTVGVVVAFGQILPKVVLDTPTHGCINVHASLLPRWRGAAPIQRAIMAGDSESGVCLMQMDEGLDTGPVFVSVREAIASNETAGTLHDTLALRGAELLARELCSICAGTCTSVPQPQEGVTYAPKISDEEACLDWTKPAHELELMVRGLSPAPGAFSYLHGRRLKILFARARSELSTQRDVKPGVITLLDRGRLEVKCGVGVLQLEELQIEGKKRMGVTQFLNGVDYTVGDQLGGRL